jgi:hypothetical protein
MLSREYVPEDHAHAVRIQREVGWLEGEKTEGLDCLLECGRTRMADLRGRPECMGISVPGYIRHLESDLPLSAVLSITTGYAGRKRGLAGRMTAELMALDRADGAAVAMLGVFDHGYYDRLGFGAGSPDTWMGIDPAYLRVDMPDRPPERLDTDDFEEVHRCRLSRMRRHGSCVLTPAGVTHADMVWEQKNPVGLGYRDDEGELTHHLWLGSCKGEHGPYWVAWLCYRSWPQLVELLGVLRSLGDQVHLVRVKQPEGFPLLGLLDKPLKRLRAREGSRYAPYFRSVCYWQVRILDLPECMESTRVPWGSAEFNLDLADPVGDFLGADAPWRGTAGQWTVRIGPESCARPGHRSGLPLMRASVGAFSRLWLGSAGASALASCDRLHAPQELLSQLDDMLRMPQPFPDWDF